MKLPEIIGVAGTNGSGKDTLAAVRAERQRCLHVTVSDILRDQLRIDKVPIERENLANLSRRWREESGDNGILVTKTIERYLGERTLYDYNGLSVVSLRHPDEAQRVKDHDGLIVWVDADPELRYERIRDSQRNRPEDNKTFDEFLNEEARDMTPVEDASPGSVNLGAVRPLADIVVVNDFDTQIEYINHLVDRFELVQHEASRIT